MARSHRRWMKLGMVAVAVASLFALFEAPAAADTIAISNTANTTTVWQTGTYNYVESHTGDDFAIRIDTGPSLDARWVTCSGSQIGTNVYFVPSGGSYVTIGTNFLAGTCLHLMFKGHSSTGTWTGVAYWNYSWA